MRYCKYTGLFILFLFLMACGVQKRRYQKGFYVNWKSSTEKKQVAKHNAAPLQQQPVTQQVVEPVYAAADKDMPASSLQKTALPLIKKDGPCDVIVFKSGEEVQAKVTEITPTEIKYKKCDMTDGPTFVERKSKIFMIKYANGTRDVFKDTEPAQGNQVTSINGHPITPDADIQIHKASAKATTSLVLGIISVVSISTIVLPLILGILAIVFGSTALRRVRYNTDYTSGRVRGRARAGMILGIIGIALFMVIMIALFLSLVFFL